MTLASAPAAAQEASKRRPGATGPLACGAVTSLVGGAGVGVGLLALVDGIGPDRVSWLIPLAGVDVAAGATAGMFLVLTGLVGIVVGIYSIGYLRHEGAGPVALVVLPLFLASMLLVPLAASVTTFAVAWELMAVLSLAAVLGDHRRESVREAARWYAAMTHAGFAAILVGLVVLAAAGGHSLPGGHIFAGGDSFAGLAVRARGMPPVTRSAVFILTVVGFGSKAGFVPFHVWLPRAHPEAPAPVSALMSAAMVTMGIYGIVRIDLQLLGPGPRWWALTVLALGGLSALFGVLQASVSVDLKRLLAYSTIENMGVVALAIGTAMLLADAGLASLAAVALAAAVLQLLAHAAFKTLGFLAAGAVVASTGVRDLDHLGGLARNMPVTTTMFSVAALGAMGLPLGAGFASEWLLLQCLIHLHSGRGVLLGVVAPLVLGAVALTTGLVVATMVKALGVGFLARPRSGGAAGAQEASSSMVAAMVIAAVACTALAVAPSLAAAGLRRVVLETPLAGRHPGPQLGLLLHLPGVSGSVSPALLAAAVVAGTTLVAAATAWAGRTRRSAARTSELWACGAGPLTERMEYTATSFAEPLQRVFRDVLRPDVDVETTHLEASRYLISSIRYEARFADTIEVHLYQPLIAAVSTWARWVRRVHNGSLHLYLAYGAAGLVVILLVSR